MYIVQRFSSEINCYCHRKVFGGVTAANIDANTLSPLSQKFNGIILMMSSDYDVDGCSACY